MYEMFGSYAIWVIIIVFGVAMWRFIRIIRRVKGAQRKINTLKSIKRRYF